MATEAHYAVTDDVDAQWEDDASPFPVVRSGYDRDAVDAYLNELEQEIDELRAHRSSDDAVSTEIKRIGEQAAAILQTAHQQAAETTRKAREEAEKCLSDAAANAISMNDEAKSKLRELDTETDAVWRERSRLIEDVRSVATALFSLAEEATERFPSEDDKRAASGLPAGSRSRLPPAPRQGPAGRRPDERAGRAVEWPRGARPERPSGPAAEQSEPQPAAVRQRRPGLRDRSQSPVARITSEALTTAVTAVPSASPSSSTASTVIEATRR